MSFRPTPYRPRTIRSLPRLEGDGWRVKRYSVTRTGEDLDEAAYDGIAGRVLEALPTPAETPGRPGLAFLILHQGRRDHYGVLGWWERENELFTRVWTRVRAEGSEWNPAVGGETACVWDLLIFALERNAYVETILAPGGPRPGDYLARTLEGQV